jgi:hypothetical protein
MAPGVVAVVIFFMFFSPSKKRVALDTVRSDG